MSWHNSFTKGVLNLISNELILALERLGVNAASIQDIELVKRAIESGSLALHREQVSVGGTVQGSIVIGDGNTIYTLTPELYAQLHPVYIPPSLPPSATLLDPGPQLPGWRLPFPRNALFTGRESDLLALAKPLLYDHNPAAISQPASLTGMGGLGKT